MFQLIKISVKNNIKNNVWSC